MAKTRPASSKKARSKKLHHKRNGRPDAAAPKPSKSPRVLVAEAEAAMTQGDVQVALSAARKAQQALEEASSGGGSGSNNIVLDGVGLAAACALVGEISLESGNVDGARMALERAVQLDPAGALPEALGGGVDKFLYLAQLSEDGGRDSLAWFERGAAALRTAIALGDEDDKGAGGDDDARKTLADKLAQVLCAMAEVWMTDLSFEDDCEQHCEALATEATLVAPASSEAWQTLASVRISQSRDADARAALQRSLALWEALPPEHPDMPAFSVRVSLARMLMTAGWLDKAVEVTAHLLREDEQSVEVWYLAGFAHYLQGQQLREAGEGVSKKNGDSGDHDDDDDDDDDDNDWKSTWLEARRCLGRCLRRFRQQEYEDERLGEHATELLREVEAAVGEAPQKEKDEEDEDEDEDEEEWEDEDEGGDDEDEEMEE